MKPHISFAHVLLGFSLGSCGGQLSEAGGPAGSGGANPIDTSAGTGGTPGSGTGGTPFPGTGGAPSIAVYLYTFTDYDEVYLAAPGTGMPVPNDLTPISNFTWDSQDGAPDPVADAGSLRIQAPFSAYTQPDQCVDFQFLLDNAPVDLTGKTLFVYLKLDSGFSPDPAAPGGFIFYARSGPNWDWGQAPWQNLDPSTAIGKWRKYTFNLSMAESGTANVAPFDPSQVTTIGIRLDTGTPTVTPLPAPPTPAMFHVDSIGYQ